MLEDEEAYQPIDWGDVHGPWLVPVPELLKVVAPDAVTGLHAPRPVTARILRTRYARLTCSTPLQTPSEAFSVTECTSRFVSTQRTRARRRASRPVRPTRRGPRTAAAAAPSSTPRPREPLSQHRPNEQDGKVVVSEQAERAIAALSLLEGRQKAGVELNRLLPHQDALAFNKPMFRCITWSGKVHAAANACSWNVHDAEASG